MIVTLKDVAELSNVSVSTASRVLHGGSIRVSDETRTRIENAAQTLNYRPNATARSLRTRVTRTLGMMIPDIQNPVYAEMIAGAEHAAQLERYAVLLMNAASRNRRKTFIDLLAEGRLDGMIVADATLDDQSLKSFVTLGLPFVLVNRRTREDLPHVVLDESAGAALGIRHLYELGHQCIGYLAGPRTVETAALRLEGALRQSAELGIPIGPQYVQACGFNGEGVDSAMDKLLDLKPRPTAISTANVMMAFAALRYAHMRDIPVPHDLSIVGYHDTPFANFTSPALTTIEMPLWEVGKRAVEHMLARLAGAPLESEIVTSPGPKLIVRQSTAPPP